MAWKFFTAQGSEKRIPATVTPHAARIVATGAGQSIPNAATTDVTLGTVDYDTSPGSAMTTANANKITIQTAGKYLIEGGLGYAASAGGSLRQVWFGINGVDTLSGKQVMPLNATSNQRATVLLVKNLSAGDTVALRTYQDSGGALALEANTATQAELSVTKIDGAAISYVGVPGSLVGQELAYAERTSNVTINSVAEGSATTIVTAGAVTVDGSTPLIVEFFAPSIAYGGSGITSGINLWMDGVDQGRLFDGSVVGSVSANYPLGTVTRRITPSAGSRTFSVRGWCGATNLVVQGGTGGAGQPLPMFIRVTRAA